MKTDPVKTVLFEAEKSLAAIANEVVKAGEYSRATVILGIASQLAAIARGLDAESTATLNAAIRPDKNSDHPTGTMVPNGKRKKGKRSAYPKFYRDGNALLKVGFSKRAGEYEHKAPSQVVFALTDAVARACEKGRRFTMDDVMPLISAALATTVPVYQPYVCLSWLRELGLVAQHGRKGYSAKMPSQISLQVRNYWEQLPTRPNSLD